MSNATLLHRAELDQLYRRATGNRTAHGAQLWASRVLNVDERTARRWIAGDTRPARAQLVRLRVAADVAERARQIGAERRAGLGLWRRLRARLDRVDELAEAEAERRRERFAAVQTRSNAAFASTEARVPGGDIIYTAGRLPRGGAGWLSRHSSVSADVQRAIRVLTDERGI